MRCLTSDGQKQKVEVRFGGYRGQARATLTVPVHRLTRAVTFLTGGSMPKKNRFYGYRPQKTQRQYKPNFARYEFEKQAWLDANPGATPDKRDEEIRAIATRCGI